MNFLSHLHLSYPDQEEMTGNFIGDYVKGKQYKNYPENISRGILLHRKIDEFTDNHPLQKRFKNYFREDYGLYAGIISDMLMDHFLAKNWEQYSTLSLNSFADLSYQILFDHFDDLPQRVQSFLPKMRRAGRLESYVSKEGIENAIHLMTRYTSLPDHTSEAMAVLSSNNKALESLFYDFYQDLIGFVEKQ